MLKTKDLSQWLLRLGIQEEQEPMVKAEKPKPLRKRNNIYKWFILWVKILPTVLIIFILLNMFLCYNNIVVIEFNYIAGVSLFFISLLYGISYILQFCKWHRMFIHYTVLYNVISVIDLYIGIPIKDIQIIILYLLLLGVFICLTVYYKLNE